jgi:hypothetical protein
MRDGVSEPQEPRADRDIKVTLGHCEGQRIGQIHRKCLAARPPQTPQNVLFQVYKLAAFPTLT